MIRHIIRFMILTLNLFMKRIKVHPRLGCWEYAGAIDSGGYGRVFVAGKEQKATRIAYQLAIGPLAKGVKLYHFMPKDKCLGRICCNPTHLTTSFLEMVRHEDYIEAVIVTDSRTCNAGHVIEGKNAITEIRPDGRVRLRCRICQQQRWREKNWRTRGSKQSEQP